MRKGQDFAQLNSLFHHPILNEGLFISFSFFHFGCQTILQYPIVLFKMFSRWFFANNKTNITSTALKLCSPTEDVMS